MRCNTYNKRSRILITGGMILILAALGLVVSNFLADSRAGAAAEDTLRILEREINEIQTRDRAAPSPADNTDKENSGAMTADTDPVDSTNPAESADSARSAKPAELGPAATLHVNGYDCIGILEIPRLGIRLPVLAEWDRARLETAPCLYSGSWQQDNMVICGHNYRRHFSPIKTIRPGTEVRFKTVDGQIFRYLVSRRETVQPERISDMTGESPDSSSSRAGGGTGGGSGNAKARGGGGNAEVTKDWDLTLFTCNTGGRTRCAVRCVRRKTF